MKKYSHSLRLIKFLHYLCRQNNQMIEKKYKRCYDEETVYKVKQ